MSRCSDEIMPLVPLTAYTVCVTLWIEVKVLQISGCRTDLVSQSGHLGTAIAGTVAL